MQTSLIRNLEASHALMQAARDLLSGHRAPTPREAERALLHTLDALVLLEVAIAQQHVPLLTKEQQYHEANIRG